MSTNLVELHAFKGYRYEGYVPSLKSVLEMSTLDRGQEQQEMKISLRNVSPVPWHSCTIKV